MWTGATEVPTARVSNPVFSITVREQRLQMIADNSTAISSKQHLERCFAPFFPTIFKQRISEMGGVAVKGGRLVYSPSD